MVARSVKITLLTATILRSALAPVWRSPMTMTGGLIGRKRETGSVSPTKFDGHKTFALVPHTPIWSRSSKRNSRIARWQSLRLAWRRKK
jgi:hypothetical protein